MTTARNFGGQYGCVGIGAKLALAQRAAWVCRIMELHAPQSDCGHIIAVKLLLRATHECSNLGGVVTVGSSQVDHAIGIVSVGAFPAAPSSLCASHNQSAAKLQYMYVQEFATECCNYNIANRRGWCRGPELTMWSVQAA